MAKPKKIDYQKTYPTTYNYISALKAAFPQYKKYKHEDFFNLYDQIARVETNDQNIAQIGGGPGRGYYQVEGPSAKTAYARSQNIAKELEARGQKIKLPTFKEDFTQLDKDSQTFYITSNLIGAAAQKRKKDPNYYLDPTNPEKVWLELHWAGDPKDLPARQKRFREVNPVQKAQIEKAITPVTTERDVDWGNLLNTFIQTPSLLPAVLQANFGETPQKKNGGPVYNWIPEYPRTGAKYAQGGWLEKYANGGTIEDQRIPTPTTPSYYPDYPDRTLTNYQMGTPKAPMYAHGATVYTNQEAATWVNGTEQIGTQDTRHPKRNTRTESPATAIPYPEIKITGPTNPYMPASPPVLQGYNPYKGPMRLHAPTTTKMAKHGGQVTEEYKKRAGIPYAINPGVSDAGMYVGPTTQRGITFGNGGWLDSYKEGGETTSLVNQALNETRPQASSTFTTVPATAQTLNTAFNKEQDLARLSDEEFTAKYNEGKNKYQYRTNPQYKAAVDKHVKAVEKSGHPVVKQRVEVNPNMMFMVPSRGYTPETAQALVDANLETIGAALPIPGIETVGAVPSVFKGIKGINKALTKEAQGIIAGSLLQRQVKNTNPFKIKAPEIIRVDPINRSTVNIKNDIYNQLGEENYNKLLQELYQQNKSAYDNPLVEFKSASPTSFYPNITNVSDKQALLFKEKFCLPGSACAKSANSVANKLYTDVTGLPFDVNANAHNAWHMEDQMMRHGAKDVTSESLKVGDRILMGNAVDQSTFVPGYTADPSIRHAGTYAGIRIVDGKAVPVLLESGSNNPMYLNPISDTFTGPATAKKAFRPQQFIDDKFGESLADKNIRYSFRDKPSVATYSSKNPEVQNILSAAESYREDIKKTYDITNDEFDELLNSLIGIGAQETKLNATLPSSKLSKAKIVLQNKLAETGLTEPVKKGINVVKKGLSALEKTPKNNLPSYPGAAKIEMEAAILAEKEGVSFKDALVKVKANYKPKPKHTLLTTTPSKGIFRQKFQPESARLAGFNSDLLSKNSVENALSQMSENYNKVKQMYPNATPRQLIDLTTLMWNSPGKATNKELVNFYLFGKNNPNPNRFNFDYISKVNNFRNQLIDLQLRGTDPHNEFFRTNNSSLGPYPEIQYKQGGLVKQNGWLDNL